MYVQRTKQKRYSSVAEHSNTKDRKINCASKQNKTRTCLYDVSPVILLYYILYYISRQITTSEQKRI